jgi:hypothetical protein
MSKVPFTKADVVRTIESAKAAGLKVETVEVVTPQGTIIRVSGERKCSSVGRPAACRCPRPLRFLLISCRNRPRAVVP